MLKRDQLKRYNRQIIIKKIGKKGQERLLGSKVLVIGAGGLGSAAAIYLAAAGVGAIGIADSDSVELSNLQRQVIHFTPDLNKKKVDSAKEKISSLNPDVRVDAFYTKADASNIGWMIDQYDFIIDATDNFDSKFLINDACVKNKKPFSHAGVLGFEGQTFTYVPGSACYRCMFDTPPAGGDVPEPAKAGVIGFVPGIIGTIQAAEAIRYILGIGDLLVNRVLRFDGLSMDFRTMKIKPDPDCPACGRHSSIKL